MKQLLTTAGLLTCCMALASCGPMPANNNSNLNTNTAPTATGSLLPDNVNAIVPPVTNSNVVPHISENIRVTMPLAGAEISSPVNLEGSARGWFFEASFPVTIVDANGVKLYEGSIQATDDWMTQAFVPFKQSVTYTAPTADTGKIIFMKSNPSDLPENNESYEMPVTFKR